MEIPSQRQPHQSGEMGWMLLATGPGGPSGSPPAEEGDTNPALREPSLKREVILALRGTPSWQEAGLNCSWGERTWKN